MEVSSTHQMTVFLLSVLSGMLCGIFFDGQRFLRRIHSASEVRVVMEDVLFAAVSIAIILGFGLFFDNGEIRYYQIMGSVSGVLFYAAFLSRLVMRLFSFFYKIFRAVIVVPIIKICHLLSVPAKKIIRITKKTSSGVKRQLKKAVKSIKKRKKHIKKRMKML